ncbi:MAG: GNAT family N-acetyltransferase [Erysipelotrichaceae bacterium]|nr:GNAT family N-acetyltransferase [Erysipelotrichaceae bacterium]
MTYQFYEQLPQDAQMIREEVFIKEQGFQIEFDDIDHHCLHLVLYKDNKPVGCARMYDENGQMILGRIAVLKTYRHLHLGTQILEILENKAKELGYHSVYLSAQVRASDFYKKNGYIRYGEEYLDEYCPHCHMKKDIE